MINYVPQISTVFYWPKLSHPLKEGSGGTLTLQHAVDLVNVDQYWSRLSNTAPIPHKWADHGFQLPILVELWGAEVNPGFRLDSSHLQFELTV